MAYEIVGTVYNISTTENIQTKNGSAFHRRSLTLIQRRFDQNTGQEFEPNYPTIDFTREKCGELDRYKRGDKVRVRFDISGAKHLDKNTNEEKYFNSLRGFRIEPYVQPNSQPQYHQQPQNYAPAGQYQQQAPQQPAPQQQGYVQPSQQQWSDNNLPF